MAEQLLPSLAFRDCPHNSSFGIARIQGKDEVNSDLDPIIERRIGTRDAGTEEGAGPTAGCDDVMASAMFPRN